MVLALRRLAHPQQVRLRGAVERAVAWTLGMQSRDGGWASFDADNTRELVTKLPFCDFGAVIDPPSADVTAHAVEMLAAEGLVDSPACRRGVAWLLAAQEPDGSWFGRWGVNHVYGTGAVVPALVAAGVDPASARDPRRGRAGSPGTRTRTAGGARTSARTPTRRGSAAATSTASQTAWALLALLAAGERSAVGATAGSRCSPAPSGPTGRGTNPQYTGTGFPGAFYLNYHLYRLVFPVSALGRYLRAGS